jgi:hypothetical protein
VIIENTEEKESGVRRAAQPEAPMTRRLGRAVPRNDRDAVAHRQLVAAPDPPGAADVDLAPTPAVPRWRTDFARPGGVLGRLDAGTLSRALIGLQRERGNAFVQRAVAEAHSQLADASSLVTMDNWPTVLPRAARTTDKKDPAKDENIHVKLGTKEKKDENTVVGPFDKVVKQKVWPKKGKPYDQEYVIRAPTLENAAKGLVGTLTDQQKTFVQSIQAARADFKTDKLKLNFYGGAYGWEYGGAPKKDATPTAVQGGADTSTVEGKRKQAEQWIWEELRFEGSSASINTYDSQMLTWGRGLGAATGGLSPTMNELFKDSEIASAFHNVGVSFKDNTWLVINTETGAVETGRNALAIVQADPHILAALIAIGENEKFKQKIADAQWTAIKQHGTANVPEFALDWPKEIVQLVAHINHWGPAYGWHSSHGGYEATKGDPFDVVLQFFRLAAGKPNSNGSLSIRHMGPDTVSNFSHWVGASDSARSSRNFSRRI